MVDPNDPHTHGHDHNHYDIDQTLDMIVGHLSLKQRLGNFARFNASLLTGEGAAALYGWFLGTPVATLLEHYGANDATTTLVAHGADYSAHAGGVGAALYFLFRGQYTDDEGHFDKRRFVRDQIKLQTAHVAVDALTYSVRIAGSYYALREGIHPAAVMTGSTIGGEFLHWFAMNVVGKRLGYLDHHDHPHNI